MATKIILSGHVQGVGCRGYCARYGRIAGIRGAATNLSDGSVQVILDTDDLEEVKNYLMLIRKDPSNFFFYGRIDDIRAFSYRGRVDGDYNF